MACPTIRSPSQRAWLGSVLDSGAPFADRPIIAQRAPLLGMTAARLAAAALPRQVSPRVVAEPAAAVRGPIDRLRAHPPPLGRQTGADRMRRPAMPEPIPHRRGEPEVTFKLGGLGPPSAQIRSRLGLTGAVRAVGAAAPRQLPAHRRAVTAHQHSDPGDTRPSRPVRPDPSPLIQRHPACHTDTSTGGCGYRHPVIMTGPSQPPEEFANAPLPARLGDERLRSRQPHATHT